jgi:hypothetical protein
MTLTADENGDLRGEYNSAVGKAEDFYILTGRFDACPLSDNLFDGTPPPVCYISNRGTISLTVVPDEGPLRRLGGDIS